MISLLFLYLILISGSLFFAVFFRVRFERTLPLATLGITFILYVFGLFGPLRYGLYVIFLGAALCYLSSGARLIRDKSFPTLKGTFVTAPFFVFTVLFPLLVYANRGMYPAGWDEFTYWMPAVRSFVEHDLLTTQSHDLFLSTSYPPGLTLFRYFVTKMVTGPFGVRTFTEWPAYLGTQLLALSVLFPLMKRTCFTHFSTIFLTLAAVFLFPMVFFDELYSTVYADAPMAILCGAALATISLTPREEKDRFYYALLLMEVGLIALCKRTGFIIAAFPALALFADRMYDRFDKRDLRGTLRRAIPVVIPCVATFLPFFVWKLAARLEYDTRVALLPPAPAVTDTPAPDRFQNAVYFGPVLKKFTENLFDYHIELGTTGISLSYILLLILIPVLLYCIRHYLQSHRQEDSLRFCLTSGVTLLQVIVWLCFFLIVYTFVYGSYSLIELTSFGRYLRAGLLPAYLFILFHVLDIVSARQQPDRPVVALLLTAFLCAISPMRDFASFLGNQFPARSADAWAALQPLCAQYDALATDAGSNLFFVIDQTDDGKTLYQMTYYLHPDRTQIDLMNWTNGSGYTSEEWLDYLTSEGYDYVMIHRVQPDFVKAQKIHFRNGSIEEDCIYRVDAATRLLVPVP